MRTLKHWFFQKTDALKELVLLMSLSWSPFHHGRKEAPLPVVVALTSYPQRISSSWRAIETLLRQTMRPQSVFLVLAKEEFPDQQLPRKIRAQQRRGLNILWVDKNGKSFDKLIPVMTSHPDKAIITCDDDKYFPKNLVASLIEAHQFRQDAIIGARGWSMRQVSAGGNIRYGDNWVRAVPGEEGLHLFMPGGNGALYQPGSLHPGVTDLSQALRVCPTADDIWIWGHALKAKTTMVCLGMPPHRPVKLFSQSPALSDINNSANQTQFEKIMDELNLEVTVQEAVDKGLSNGQKSARTMKPLPATRDE